MNFKKTVKIPIYFGNLIIMLEDNWDRVNSKYGFKLNEGYDACAFMNTRSNGVTDFIMVFIGTPNHTQIAHETVHIVNYILNSRGVVLDPVNDEPQAYLTGWVTNEVYKCLNK